jgi:hypothetical protein
LSPRAILKVTPSSSSLPASCDWIVVLGRSCSWVVLNERRRHATRGKRPDRYLLSAFTFSGGSLWRIDVHLIGHLLVLLTHHARQLVLGQTDRPKGCTTARCADPDIVKNHGGVPPTAFRRPRTTARKKKQQQQHQCPARRLLSRHADEHAPFTHFPTKGGDVENDNGQDDGRQAVKSQIKRSPTRPSHCTSCVSVPPALSVEQDGMATSMAQAKAAKPTTKSMGTNSAQCNSLSWWILRTPKPFSSRASFCRSCKILALSKNESIAHITPCGQTNLGTPDYWRAPHPNGVEVCRLTRRGSYRQLGLNRGARRRGLATPCARKTIESARSDAWKITAEK